MFHGVSRFLRVSGLFACGFAAFFAADAGAVTYAPLTQRGPKLQVPQPELKGSLACTPNSPRTQQAEHCLFFRR